MNINQVKNTDKIIKRNKFRELTGFSRSKEYRLSRKGLLPSCLILDGKIQGYLESSYEQWLQHNSIGG
jgi:predicted DNA-binding transcriptional regulator AlpA